MKKMLLTVMLLLTTMASWAIQEMDTHPKVHNIGGVWYQRIGNEAWVSSRWHYGYEYDPGEFLVLQDWNSYSGDVKIAESIVWSETDDIDTPEVEGTGDTLPVVGILAEAFFLSEELTSVTISSSVKTIRDRAFSACHKLTEITFPATVDSIGADVLGECNALKKVTIADGPNKLKWNNLCNDWVYMEALEELYVGRPYETPENGNAFRALPIKKITFGDSVEEIFPLDLAYCGNLETVVFGKGLKRIGNEAFTGASKLTSADIPEGVTIIGDEAFNLTGITSINLPSTLKLIGSRAFQSTNIEELTIPASVDSIGYLICEYCNCRKLTVADGPNLLKWNEIQANGISYEEIHMGRPYITTNGAFRGFQTLKRITFGDSVEEIFNEDLAFTPLETVHLGKGMKKIAGNAFDWCGDIKAFYVGATVPPVVDGEDIGFQLYETCTLYVPENSIEAYKAAPVWKNFFNINVDPTSIEILKANVPADEKIFTLDGCNVTNDRNSLGKGIYIVNGKKVIVK